MESKELGQGIDWFRADSWSCSLDYRRIRGAALALLSYYRDEMLKDRDRIKTDLLSSISLDTEKIIFSGNGDTLSIPLVMYQRFNKNTCMHKKPQVQWDGSCRYLVSLNGEKGAP
ncbi:RNA polymerase beta subunit [Olea europaea subsp. europaea]|uniref:RNA polymerase beta subunit, partial (Chloroplast) n=1 Tax=Olea europaea subsp. europaea TaxID=158383 RepID=A0A8S0RJ80_OLEEU|nr:RNA polymerase beta subunit [Olea europaea subsp. europaea]